MGVMGKLTRQERAEIGARVGVDERTVLAVIEGKPSKSLGVRRRIEEELTKAGADFANRKEQAEETSPEAEPTTSTPTGEG